MKVRIAANCRVRCEAVIQLPLSAGAAWGQLRDFKSSATHDPFHAEIIIDGEGTLHKSRRPSGRGLRRATTVLDQTKLLSVNAAAMEDPRNQSHGIPRAGAQLQIVHQYLFWQTRRVGRILRWKEGHGFAFSDLCAADSSKAFPHVMSYQLQPISEKSCRLRIYVGGRWTARFPRCIGRIWLWWVFSQVVRKVQNQLLRFALGMKLRSALVG